MEFLNFEDLVNKVNDSLTSSFSSEFQLKRKTLAGKKKVADRKVFGNIKADRQWAINKGGGSEIQYHIAKSEQEIYYGLGFNAQYVPYNNSKAPQDLIRPFTLGFLNIAKEAKTIFPHYDYIFGDESKLRNIGYDDYVLWGNRISFAYDEAKKTYSIDDNKYENLVKDLKDQFPIYIKIYEEANEMKTIPNYLLNHCNLLEAKKQIILQGAPGTGKTYTAEEIAYQLVFDEVLSKEKTERKIQLERLEASGQYELVQFHPAYTYEDFVRGIVIENKGEQIVYTTKNKILGALADKAQRNKEDSEKLIEELSKEQQIEAVFKEFEEEISDYLETNDGKLALNSSVDVIMVEGDAFRYTGSNWKHDHRMKFDDLKQLAIHNIKERQAIKKNTFVSGLARQHATYFLLMLNEFYERLDKHGAIDEVETIPLKKYVLVIDEINRANLPSVLGELIYALEYRGRKVESMYAMDDDKRSIVIPSNLYIIGTMNTADRSVGHIDYAIRRRFSFVDILPNKEVVPDFAQDLFKSVSELFIKNYDAYYENPSIVLEASDYLSSDFRPEDIWVGHSYFMSNDKEGLQMKFDYEIKPLLKEYVKDGILSTNAIEKIQELYV